MHALGCTSKLGKVCNRGGSSRFSDRCINRKCEVTIGTVGATERRRREHLGGSQPRSQGLRCETVTKTLVKFVLSFQNFGKKIACAVRHNRIAITVEYGCVSLRMRFFSQNFGTIKRILPGSSSPSHREGPKLATENFEI